MKISEKLGINKSQHELDFVNVDLERDTPLFLDPYFISKSESPLAQRMNTSIKSFFEYLLELLNANRVEAAKELFSMFDEPNETCLGLSVGKPNGRTVNENNTMDIFDSLLTSRALETEAIEDIEDLKLFVYGVAKDKLSDMITCICRKELYDYTVEQCKLYNISLSETSVVIGYAWNRAMRKWDNFEIDFIIDERPILLVPKFLVSYTTRYTKDEFYNKFALEFLQNEHLRLQSHLVQYRKAKKGEDKGEPFVTKKSIKDLFENQGINIDKNWISMFIEQHPTVFKDFKEKAIDNYNTIEAGYGENISEDEVVEFFKNELINTSSGPEEAHKYHSLMIGILEFLFYPSLTAPIKEREIHEGRKRIDIIFENSAKEGFFDRITDVLPAIYIVVECKNYSRDIQNPELDQIAGRFSTRRGKVGLLICRDIKQMDQFMKRCRDTFNDDRGLIIPIVDSDILSLLDSYKTSGRQTVNKMLMDKYSFLSS